MEHDKLTIGISPPQLCETILGGQVSHTAGGK